MMKSLLCVLGAVCLVQVSLAAKAAAKNDEPNCMFLGYPELEYDGKDRTEVLTDKNFNKTVFADGEKSVVFFNDVEADDDEQDQYECFLQLSAQILEKRGYEFYTVNTTKEVKLAHQEDVEDDEDTIHVYEDGYQIEYHGVRDPQVFVSWVMDIPDEPLTIINDKDDKKDFEEMEDECVRVIGYFEPGSQALEEYHEAAEEYMGEIEFFAVVDSHWAKKMGLDTVGEVHMYRPFEKDPIEAPLDADTEDEFEDWVEDHMEPVMQKLTPQNYFNVWKDTTDEEKMIVVFVDEEEDDGEAVVKLFKNLARENAEHAGTLEIVLIDPDEFPLMVDIWEEMFEIDIEEDPAIGLVDLDKEDGIWFDMNQLNLNEPKKHKESNLEVLQAWIDQVLDGSIDIDGHSAKPTGKAPKSRQKSKPPQRKRRNRLRSRDTESDLEEEEEDYFAVEIRRTTSLKSLKNQRYTMETNELRKTISILQRQIIRIDEMMRTLSMDRPSKRQELVKPVVRLSRPNFTAENRWLSGTDNGSGIAKIVDATEDLGQLTKAGTTPDAAKPISLSSPEHPILAEWRRLFPPKPQSGRFVVKSKRRCSRRRTKNCNPVEFYTALSQVIMLLVSSFMICLLRMMRITVSFYICPVVDDMRDYLRRNLPENIRSFMTAHNIRF